MVNQNRHERDDAKLLKIRGFLAAVAYSWFLVAYSQASGRLYMTEPAAINGLTSVTVHVCSIFAGFAIVQARGDILPRRVAAASPVMAATAYLALEGCIRLGLADEKITFALICAFAVFAFVTNVVQYGALRSIALSRNLSTVAVFAAGSVLAVSVLALLSFRLAGIGLVVFLALGILSPAALSSSFFGLQPERPTAEQAPAGKAFTVKVFLGLLVMSACRDVLFSADNGFIGSFSQASVLPMFVFVLMTMIHLFGLTYYSAHIGESAFVVFCKQAIVMNAILVCLESGLSLMGSAVPQIALDSSALAFVAAALYVYDAIAKARQDKGVDKTPSGEPDIASLFEGADLTRREAEVATLLAEGRSAPFIQERLSISRGTAWTHIGHIYDKLNVNSRQEFLNVVEQFKASERPRKEDRNRVI